MKSVDISWIQLPEDLKSYVVAEAKPIRVEDCVSKGCVLLFPNRLGALIIDRTWVDGENCKELTLLFDGDILSDELLENIMQEPGLNSIMLYITDDDIFKVLRKIKNTTWKEEQNG